DEGPGRRKVLAFLFLRGAMDGLNVLSPHGDPRFAQMRPTLALPSPGEERKTNDGPGALLDLGVPGFGLHPSLEPLLPLCREGTLAFVHAVARRTPRGRTSTRRISSSWARRASRALRTAGWRAPGRSRDRRVRRSR